jgi:hypothetical protein
MTGKPFDIERLRKNWERAAPPEPARLPAKIARVRRPRDPFAEATTLLDRITTLARAEFPAHMATLSPFIAEAVEIVRRMQGSESAAPAEDLGALRQEFQKVLDDLEDLFEVFARIGR